MPPAVPASTTSSDRSSSTWTSLSTAAATAARAAAASGPVGRPTSTRSPPSLAFSSDGVPSATTRPASMTVIRSARLVGLLEVLRGEQHRRAQGDHVAYGVPDVGPPARVEPGRRLVEEQHRRSGDEAGGDVEPAPHAAGVRRHLAVRRVGDVRSPPAARRRAPAPRRSRGRAGGRTSRGSRVRGGSRRARPTARPGRSPSAPARGSVRTSKPATRASPSSMRVSVAKVWTAVLLPAPFGPRSACTEPARHVEVEAVEGERVAVPLAQSAGFEGWWE